MTADIFFWFFGLFFVVLTIASLALIIWTIVEIARKPFVNEKDKILWLIIVLLFGGFGSLIYLTQRKKLLAQDNLQLFDLNDTRQREAHLLPLGTREEDSV
jgi:hypothetical protein